MDRAALYPAPPGAEAPAVPDGTLVRTRSPEGRAVFALHVPAPDGEPTVAYFHGNGEQIADLDGLAAWLRAERLGLYAVEYPGYGLARADPPDEAALYDVAEAALAHLRDGLRVGPRDTVLMGRSLGTGVAVEMARRGRGARLVLVSPYTSVADLASYHLPLIGTLFFADRYDNAAKAPGVAVPVLLVHGTRDGIIPPQMSARLEERFPQAAALWVVGAHHNDLYARHRREIVRHIGLFARLDREPAR